MLNHYLHKPACSPAPDPGKTELSDLVIAAAAAKMVKLDPGVPEPTAEEFGAQYCKKVLGCCQRGQWDLASETLKVTADHLLIIVLEFPNFDIKTIIWTKVDLTEAFRKYLGQILHF